MTNHGSTTGSHACPSCQLTFSNKDELNQHLLRHSDGDWPCNNCLLQFDTKEALEKHMTLKHNNNPENSCKFCNEKFSAKSILKRHIVENHFSYKPCNKFASQNCDFDFECRFNHVTLESGQVICFKCGQLFNDKTLMIKHVIETHGKEPCKKFQSNQCSFPSNQCFFSHIMIHPNRSPAPPSNRSNPQTQVTHQNQGFQETPQNTPHMWPQPGTQQNSPRPQPPIPATTPTPNQMAIMTQIMAGIMSLMTH